MPEPVLTGELIDGPAEAAEQREQVSLALLTLLEHLTPEQRVVYVLREGFGSSYEDIAAHLGKTPSACRQVFRRARQRVEESDTHHAAPSPDHDALIMRFMDAFARGDAAAVASVLAEDVVWTADGGPNRIANRKGIRGRDRVSRGFAGFGKKGRANERFTIKLLDVNGEHTIVVFHQGQLERILAFDTAASVISHVRVIVNPEKLRHLAASLGTEPAWETPFPLPRRARTEG